MSKTIKSEKAPEYKITKDESFFNVVERHADDEIIRQALNIIGIRIGQTEKNVVISDPNDTKRYLTLKLAQLEHEVFAVMFLDNRHRVIKYEEMFRGTIDGASVYPREVVKRALQLNAAALILSHNHPSGVPEPSQSDERITIRLKEACSLVDIRILDHIIIGGSDTVSLAERGIL